MTDPTLTAEQVKRFAACTRKPILASWMGGAEVASGTIILNRASIPTFPYPDTAAQIFDYMWHYRSNLRSLYETPLPSLEFDTDGPDRSLAKQVVDSARQSGRTLLTEVEAKQLLAAYGIPTVETRVATNEAEASQARRGNRLPSRAQALVRNDYAQERRGRRAVTSGRARLQCAMPTMLLKPRSARK